MRPGTYNLVLVGEGGKTRRVNTGQCAVVAYREIECTVDGQRVASYTGPVREAYKGVTDSVARSIPGLRSGAGAPQTVADVVKLNSGSSGVAWADSVNR
jgi:hypothetical protein